LTIDDWSRQPSAVSFQQAEQPRLTRGRWLIADGFSIVNRQSTNRQYLGLRVTLKLAH